MNIKQRSVVGFVVVALVLATSSTAFATHYAGHNTNDDAAGGLLSTSTTSGGITTTAGGVVLTVMLAGGSGDAALETYLRQNSVAVQHDLHIGGGETARDLAVAFNVPKENFAEFAEILHDNRNELARLAVPGDVDSISAQRFSRIVTSEMLEHRALAEHVTSQFS